MFLRVAVHPSRGSQRVQFLGGQYKGATMPAAHAGLGQPSGRGRQLCWRDRSLPTPTGTVFIQIKLTTRLPGLWIAVGALPGSDILRMLMLSTPWERSSTLAGTLASATQGKENWSTLGSSDCCDEDAGPLKADDKRDFLSMIAIVAKEGQLELTVTLFVKPWRDLRGRALPLKCVLAMLTCWWPYGCPEY